MSLRLPQASGQQVVRLLGKLGYEVIRQRGSHVRMRKSSPLGAHHITVPAHRTVALGTLNDILSRVSLWNNMPKGDLIRRLREL